MSEPWNSATLLPPPISLFKSNYKIDVNGLKHVGNNIIRVLSKQSPLHKESALCSRFLYKYDMKFRHDIGYRNLKKVHTALKKYLALNLLKDIDDFVSTLPADDDDTSYLPTRQMLEYILLRVIAFSKIMLRITICAKQAGVFYLDRLKRGESHWMCLMPYALVSRLWSMCMVLLQHSTSWYSGLYLYLSKLQLKGMPFLPSNFSLPEDLEQWLDLKNMDNFGRFEWAQRKFVQIDPSLIENDDNDVLENILDYVNSTNDDGPEVVDSVNLLDKSTVKKDLLVIAPVKQVDQGEVLSRESFRTLSLPKRQEIYKQTSPVNTGVSNYVHSDDNITNDKSLKLFIDKEEEYRNESNLKSLTSHLSFMQWQALKNSLLKLCNELSNRKIQRHFKKIWKEKCLDYV